MIQLILVLSISELSDNRCPKCKISIVIINLTVYNYVAVWGSKKLRISSSVLITVHRCQERLFVIVAFEIFHC